MPKRKQINQTKEILKYLRRYGSITRALALSHFGCFDLPDRIRKIRRSYLKTDETVECIEEGNTKYRLEKVNQ